MADALLWAREDALRCSGCGLPVDETTQPGRDNAYEAVPVACHACAARDRADAAWREQKGDRAGLGWRITERAPVG